MSVGEAIATATREHADLVDAARRRVPKAWGRLAAQGVGAFRRSAGRAPTDAERRAIWAGLWAAVTGDRGPMRQRRAIDLNSDLGEGAGTDDEIMPLITSANVACGAHAGDAETMRRTVRLALERGVSIGAHPGYRDPANFGRLPLDIASDELLADLARQLEELRATADAAGARLAHVKAHGALYNQAERDEKIAQTIAEAVRRFDEDLVLFASPGSAMRRAAERSGIRVAREGFADRAYEPDGTLRSRRLPSSVHTDPTVAAQQAVSIARDRKVRTSDGSTISIEADTLCIHGDTPGAPAIARAVREALAASGVAVTAFVPR